LLAIGDQKITDDTGYGFSGHDKPEAEVKSSLEVTYSPLHVKLVSADAHLQVKTLWNQFHALGTEMIVTKAGRYLLLLSLNAWLSTLWRSGVIE